MKQDMAKKKIKMSQAEQSALFRESAKKAEVSGGKTFERAFKKIVPVRSPSKKN
jgi:uncharacterized protein YehS (DUF1456 family)